MSVVPSLRNEPWLTMRSPGSIPRLQGAGAADADEGGDADPGQLLDGDGRRRAAHAGRRDGDVAPLYEPTIVRCSRLWATSTASVRYSATSGTRNGSPGMSATVLTSPGATPMWNWRTTRPALLLSTMLTGGLRSGRRVSLVTENSRCNLARCGCGGESSLVRLQKIIEADDRDSPRRSGLAAGHVIATDAPVDSPAPRTPPRQAA